MASPDVIGSSHTLQLNRHKRGNSGVGGLHGGVGGGPPSIAPKPGYNSLQRHSSTHLDYDNVENCQGGQGGGNMAQNNGAQRARSRTLGDGMGKWNERTQSKIGRDRQPYLILARVVVYSYYFSKTAPGRIIMLKQSTVLRE